MVVDYDEPFLKIEPLGFSDLLIWYLFSKNKIHHTMSGYTNIRCHCIVESFSVKVFLV